MFIWGLNEMTCLRCQTRSLLVLSCQIVIIDIIKNGNVFLVSTCPSFLACKIQHLVLPSFNEMMAFLPFNSLSHHPATYCKKKKKKKSTKLNDSGSAFTAILKDPWNVIDDHLVIILFFNERAGSIMENLSRILPENWLLMYFVVIL